MELKSIMSGSIDNLEKKDIRPRLTHFMELLDAYNLMNVLSNDDAKDLQLKFAVQKIEDVTVQTIMASTFRINLHDNDSIQVTINKRLGNYDTYSGVVDGFKDMLNELKIKHRTTTTNKYGLLLKSTFDIENYVNDEDILKIFQYLKLD